MERGIYEPYAKGYTLVNKIKIDWVHVNPETKTYSYEAIPSLGQTKRRLAPYFMDDIGWVPAPYWRDYESDTEGN
jgi:hypothetical protein